MRRQFSSTRSATGALFLCAAIAVVLAAVVMRPAASAAPDAFWLRLRIDGLEADHFASLADMVDGADAVVIATIDSVEFGRAIHGDVPEEDLTYAQVNLKVTRILSGRAPEIVPLEFIAGMNAAGPEASIQALRESVPTGSAIYFLHEKRGAGERGKYRVTNSTGLWARTTRAQLDTPLRDESPRVSTLYGSELGSVSTIDELSELLAQYAAKE